MDDADRRAAELLAAYYDDVVAESRPRLRGLIAGAIRDGRSELLAAAGAALLLLDDRGLGGCDELGDYYAGRVEEEADRLRAAIAACSTDLAAAGPRQAE
jgi:hypothetical protein